MRNKMQTGDEKGFTHGPDDRAHPDGDNCSRRARDLAVLAPRRCGRPQTPSSEPEPDEDTAPGIDEPTARAARLSGALDPIGSMILVSASTGPSHRRWFSCRSWHSATESCAPRIARWVLQTN
jgi:hypothetical protein